MAAALLGVLLATSGATPAFAHAQLLSTDPTDGTVLRQAPETVTFTFNEPVRLTAQEVVVYDAEGDPVPSAATAAGPIVSVALEDPGAMTDGTYVVGWFVVSADGHPVSGSLSFSVGERSDDVVSPPPAPSSSRVVTVTLGVLGGAMYVGLLVAAGLAAFVALVLPASYAGERTRGRIRKILRVAGLLAVVGALATVPVAAVYAQGAELTDLPGALDPGVVVAELLSAALLTAGVLLLLTAVSERTPSPRERALMLAGAALMVAAPAIVGHTRSYQPQAVLVAADLLHVGAGAVWLGGLVGLTLALRPLAAARDTLAASTLTRFSELAGGLLLAVAAAGTVLAWRVLGSWSAFLDTGYGQLLLVKLGVALLVVATGAWNRFRMLPAVQAAAGYSDRGRAAARVTRTVRAEALLVVALLAVTGFLVNQSPRPAPVEVPEGRTGVRASSVDDLRVLAVMTPRTRGPNVLLVQLQDETGEPFTPPRAPTVELRSGDIDLGRVRLQNTDAGTYRADVLLPRPGTWQAQVAVRLSRFDNPVTTVSFEVADRG